MTDLDVDAWRSELETRRSEKDDFFASHPQSPIPPEERDGFDGLAYFEPDPTYRVTATVSLEEDPDADPVLMETTTGREVRYLRMARFAFDLERADEELADGRFELAGYRQEGAGGETFFLPFRDKTTGQQTYRNGRYMEVESEESLADGDTIVLDFNLAYTPFCAYSDTYDCPLPPEENWLDVTIPAGERFE